jgi:hypothetical protein
MRSDEVLSVDTNMSRGLVCKRKSQDVQGTYRDMNKRPCGWALPNHEPIVRKEPWKADPSTWLDLETSMLSYLPVELFVEFIFPSLSDVDLTMFLLCLGYNQWTSGVGDSCKKYQPIVPLPKWLSNWLWKYREPTHVRAANMVTGWGELYNYRHWIFVRNRIQFDGDDKTQVYKHSDWSKGKRGRTDIWE